MTDHPPAPSPSEGPWTIVHPIITSEDGEQYEGGRWDIVPRVGATVKGIVCHFPFDCEADARAVCDLLNRRAGAPANPLRPVAGFAFPPPDVIEQIEQIRRPIAPSPAPREAQIEAAKQVVRLLRKNWMASMPEELCDALTAFDAALDRGDQPPMQGTVSTHGPLYGAPQAPKEG